MQYSTLRQAMQKGLSEAASVKTFSGTVGVFELQAQEGMVVMMMILEYNGSFHDFTGISS